MRPAEALSRARLYFVVEAVPDELVRAALRGGVDMLQLRAKDALDDELLAAAARFRALCDEHGALFWLNDRPELALEARADGVHVGQDDLPVDEVREQVGVATADRPIDSQPGPARRRAALRGGPAQRRPGVGDADEARPPRSRPRLRWHAASAGGERPWFAIGGIDLGNVGEVVAAGARRIVVLRAIRDAGDPEAAAAALRAALPG